MSNFDFKSRIEQLTEDNAFVNVNDVLKHDGHRSDLTTSGTDLSVSFLDESNAGQPALKGLTDGALRFNLTSALADQDRAYRDWVGQLKWRRADVHRFDRVECPLDVGAALAEVERETQLLHRWKRRLIYGDSCSSAIDEYVSRCPSFEAMTAPSIERRMRNRRRLSKKVKQKLHILREDTVEHGSKHHGLCSVCLLPANYRCLRCRRALFCSAECFASHESTRCLKYTV